MATYPMKRATAAITDERTGQRVDALLARRGACSPWSVLISSDVLALLPKNSDLFRYFVGSGDDLFVRLASVIDYDTLVKTIIEDSAD